MPAVRSFRTLSPPGCGRGEGRECRNWARRRNRPSPGPSRKREGRRGVSLGVGNILREKPMTLIRLSLTDFRNHAGVDLGAGPGLVALHGDNGAGKTNILEAISLLPPGRGLRRDRKSVEPGKRGSGRED